LKIFLIGWKLLPLISNAKSRYVKATIILPEEYLGRVIELCEANRGQQKSIEFFRADQVILIYDIPAAQLVDDLFGKLKGATYVYCLLSSRERKLFLLKRANDSRSYSKGYATLDYEDAGWHESKLVKLQLLVNKQPVDAICKVVHLSQTERLGRHWVTKFKEHVDRQMFGK
jgi:translation elongation factor EF-4